MVYHRAKGGVGILLQVVAFACLAMSLPVAALKYPWLPATIREFAETKSESSYGSPSYEEDRERRLERTELALTLYAAGTLALYGLVGIVVGILPWWADLFLWVLIAVTSREIALFEQQSVGPSTLSVYVLAAIRLPNIIAVTATGAALLTIVVHVARRRALPSAT